MGGGIREDCVVAFPEPRGGAGFLPGLVCKIVSFEYEQQHPEAGMPAAKRRDIGGVIRQAAGVREVVGGDAITVAQLPAQKIGLGVAGSGDEGGADQYIFLAGVIGLVPESVYINVVCH